MEKISYLKIFCRGGRVLILNSDELNALLTDKNDKIMLVPVFFNTDHVQIREIDGEAGGDFKNLLPNAIITSPYEPFIDTVKKPAYHLNTIPFSGNKLLDDAKKLINSFNMSKLFGL